MGNLPATVCPEINVSLTCYYTISLLYTVTYELVWLGLSVSSLGGPTGKRKAVPYCCKHFRMLETYVHLSGPARYISADGHSGEGAARIGPARPLSDIFRDTKGLTAGKAFLFAAQIRDSDA